MFWSGFFLAFGIVMGGFMGLMACLCFLAFVDWITRRQQDG